MSSHRVERGFIRILVAVALLIALWAGSRVPVPRDAQRDPHLPAVAFDQVGLYRLEVTLLAFYGGLLLITPAFSALVRGRLPTEISARGAKFAGEADESADMTRTAIKELKQITGDLTEGLFAANLQIERMKGEPMSDSTQPAVDSDR